MNRTRGMICMPPIYDCQILQASDILGEIALLSVRFWRRLSNSEAIEMKDQYHRKELMSVSVV